MKEIILAIAIITFLGCKTITIGIGEISAFGFAVRNITFTPKSGNRYNVIGTGNTKEVAKKDCYYDAVRKYNVVVDTVVLDSMVIKTRLFNTKFVYYGTGFKR